MKIMKILGTLIFAIGALIAMILLGFSVWADFEAKLFSAASSGDTGLPSLKCPVIISESEEGTVSAKVKNPLDREATQKVDALISDGFLTLIRKERDLFKLGPGESRSLEWVVTPDNAVFNRAIFVRIIAKGGYPTPERQGTCGILVFQFANLSGLQMLALTIGSSLIFMAVGIFLWTSGKRALRGRDLNVARAMIVLALFMLAGIITTLMGLWLLGFLIFLVSILLVGGIIAYFISG